MLVLTPSVAPIPPNNLLSVCPSDVEPFTRVAQILVLYGQILGQNGAFRQSVGVRTEQPVVLVLVLVVAVARGEYVVVKLYHGDDTCVHHVLRMNHLAGGILP